MKQFVSVKKHLTLIVNVDMINARKEYKQKGEMKKRFASVYQFRITLEGITPPIWRRIQVPESYTFWDPHVAIQDAMGWKDYHLHKFTIINPSTGAKENIGIPNEGVEVLPEWRQKISKWSSMKNKLAKYIYDFGDSWRHTVELEKILPRENSIDYPRWIDGKRACPPEDCGGKWGYEEICRGESEYDDDFDPEYFDVKEVKFDNPDERWKKTFG